MKKISIPITVLLLSTHMSAQEAKQQTKNDSIKKIEEIISKKNTKGQKRQNYSSGSQNENPVF